MKGAGAVGPRRNTPGGALPDPRAGRVAGQKAERALGEEPARVRPVPRATRGRATEERGSSCTHFSAQGAQRAVPQEARDQKEHGPERERKTTGSGERGFAGGLGCLHSLVADSRGDLAVALVYQTVLVDVHAGRRIRGNAGAGARVG